MQEEYKDLEMHRSIHGSRKGWLVNKAQFCSIIKASGQMRKFLAGLEENYMNRRQTVLASCMRQLEVTKLK